MKRRAQTTDLLVRLQIVVCLAICFAACKGDDAAYQADSESKKLLSQTSQAMFAGQKPSSAEFESIKSILEKYPEAESVRSVYKMALIRREDWNALEQFLLAVPAAERSDEDKLNLAKALFKLGRYAETVNYLEEFQQRNDPEIRSILANSNFYLGKYDEAKLILDKNWEEIINQKRSDDVTLRGMIYFHEKDLEKAVATLQKALELNPDSIPAANGLSRVYAAKGEPEKAAEYVAKVQQKFDKMTTEEQRKTNLLEQVYKLQEAYKAKRFAEVIEIGSKMLPEADEKNKPALYQYLYNSYAALGKNKEAAEILAKAKEIQK